MEPMTLGSPISATGSPQIFPSSPPHPGPVQHAAFLPGFLMGDYSQQVRKKYFKIKTVCLSPSILVLFLIYDWRFHNVVRLVKFYRIDNFRVPA